MNYSVDFEEHFRSRPFFSMRDARLFLKSKGISPAYLKVFMHRQVKKGKLKRLGKGLYSFKEDLELVGFAFRPFYYGLQFALSHHSLWDQASNMVVVTPQKVRTGIRVIWGQNVVVRRISPRLFFGFELVNENEYWIPVSTIEKTFIDMVYFRQKMDAQLIESFRSRIRKPILESYLKKIPVGVQKRVKKALALPPRRMKKKG